MRRRLSYDTKVKLNKARHAKRISFNAWMRIGTDYPYLSLMDWLRLWWATWRVKA